MANVTNHNTEVKEEELSEYEFPIIEIERQFEKCPIKVDFQVICKECEQEQKFSKRTKNLTLGNKNIVCRKERKVRFRNDEDIQRSTKFSNKFLVPLFYRFRDPATTTFINLYENSVTFSEMTQNLKNITKENEKIRLKYFVNLPQMILHRFPSTTNQ